MRERKRIGILFKHNENWTGGTYYILNLVQAMNMMNESEKPELYILSETKEEYEMVQRETKYPYLFSIRLDHYQAGLFSFFKRNNIRKNLERLEMIFPYPFKPQEILASITRKVYWIGDFQEKYLPVFFSAEALKNREMINRKIAAEANEVVFSSMNAMEDFDRFYPGNRCKKYLLQFAVTHPDISAYDSTKILEKYHVKQPYVISPNQFWAHKNHDLIIDAIHNLVKQGKPVKLLFTGKEHDYRYPEYTNDLKKKVKTLGLEEHIVFLGFIDRVDQLVLMKNARAVVQASLFEGWSTVVEDTKALGVPIILSDLPVHREQNPPAVIWFDKSSVDSLASALTQEIPVNQGPGYEAEKLRYARQFSQILQSSPAQ